MTPTPTPRTDAIAHRGLGSVAYIAEMTELARQLEREIAAERALADKLAETLANVQGDYATTGAIMTQEVAESLAAWEKSRSATR